MSNAADYALYVFLIILAGGLCVVFGVAFWGMARGGDVEKGKDLSYSYEQRRYMKIVRNRMARVLVTQARGSNYSSQQMNTI